MKSESSKLGAAAGDANADLADANADGVDGANDTDNVNKGGAHTSGANAGGGRRDH